MSVAPAALPVRKRAAAVIRVSRVGKREADKFISPEDQLKMVNQMCEQHNWEIVRILYEIDQSGYRTRFEKRKGLYPATRMVEEGEADLVVMAFFDRMARNIVVQTEFLGRVGRAGGEVWAHDWGQIRTESAVAMLAAGMMGLVVMFVAQSTAEKTLGPKERAISLGIPTFPHIPAGYRKDPDQGRKLVVFEPEARLIRGAFARRAEGASYHEIRDWMRSEGLMRSTRGVQEILKNRIYLGELRFGRPKQKGGQGEMVNLHAHEAIIDRATFDTVRAMRVAKGPRGSSESVHARLLSRQGILRCATCNRAMIVSSSHTHGRLRVTYRCPTIGDCPARAGIMADNVDAYVSEWMKLAQAQGTYSGHEQLKAAQAARIRAQDEYSAVMRNLATQGTAQAQVIINEYRVAAEQAQEHEEYLRRAFGASAVRSMGDFDTLSLIARRDLVRALTKRIVVTPGRGMTVEERVDIQPFLE